MKDGATVLNFFMRTKLTKQIVVWKDCKFKRSASFFSQLHFAPARLEEAPSSQDLHGEEARLRPREGRQGTSSSKRLWSWRRGART